MFYLYMVQYSLSDLFKDLDLDHLVSGSDLKIEQKSPFAIKNKEIFPPRTFIADSESKLSSLSD